ncbi:MAG: SDR family NAD(P)-dependent oxidoreductase [[Clostridium] scindens]
MKKVLVTGATQGMGLETLIRLAGQGYEVHFTYRRSEEKAKELMERYPGQVYGHKAGSGKGRRDREGGFPDRA